MATDINTLKIRIQTVTAAVNSRKPVLLLLTGKRLEGLMKARIFNKGLDQQNSKIGSYSKAWSKVRQKRGNQTSYVDLQFKGDLIRSFKTVQDGSEAVLAIVNNSDYVKARGNEERRKKTIFEPTAGELIQIEEYFDDLVTDFVITAFKNI